MRHTEADWMRFNPFEGDFGDGEKVLADKIVTAAKTHAGACLTCGGHVAVGERHRARTEAYNGRVMTFRFCGECCDAHYDWLRGNELPLEERIRLRKANVA